MPNWCSNHAKFSHNDPNEIRKLVDAFNADALFKTFVPYPNGEWDYHWCVENWGTKWDCSCEGFDPEAVTDVTTDVELDFDTAWGPPIAFYFKMEDMGWKIDAMYYESGMQFCGTFSDQENEHIDIEGDSAWVRENVPAEVDNLFGISDSMADWEEENAQDEP